MHDIYFLLQTSLNATTFFVVCLVSIKIKIEISFEKNMKKQKLLELSKKLENVEKEN